MSCQPRQQLSYCSGQRHPATGSVAGQRERGPFGRCVSCCAAASRRCRRRRRQPCAPWRLTQPSEPASGSTAGRRRCFKSMLTSAQRAGGVNVVVRVQVINALVGWAGRRRAKHTCMHMFCVVNHMESATLARLACPAVPKLGACGQVRCLIQDESSPLERQKVCH